MPCAQGLRLRYKFWLTNGETWDYLHYHYSADEFYILPILAAYLSLHLLVLCVTFSHAVQLKSRQLLHTTFKLFWFSVSVFCSPILTYLDVLYIVH